ncbi:MAG: dihydroorotase [Calditrichaeota bacterium]|nr:MAG: dihydroorotase [Calditrichota bacterium]
MKEFNPTLAKEIFIEGGRLVDPENKLDFQANILIRNGKISAIGSEIKAEGCEILDASGCVVFPGMFDMHAHLREPGREDQETIQSGCAAAIAGGFTGLCTMPDTNPVTDSRSLVDFIKSEAEKTMVDVSPVAAITKGRKGEELAEMAELVESGVVAFSDAPRSVAHTNLLRNALDYARMFNVPIIEVCEDAELAAHGLMNEGAMSTRLGVHGIPGIAEDIIVSRNIHLAEYTGTPMHLAKISRKKSVELMRQAKKQGIKVTCDVTPHHCLLTENDLANYDTNFKVKPPLRTQADVNAIIEGLIDGTIDAIATDHAPFSPEEKQVEILVAPFGSTGLETAFPALFTHLVRTSRLSFEHLLEKMIAAPRKILNLEVPQLRKGNNANLCIWDLSAFRTVVPDEFYSRSRNSIFLTATMYGVIKAVINKKHIWNA